VPKVTLCHPEARPKDLANEREILRFAQNDTLGVTLGTLNFSHFKLSLTYFVSKFDIRVFAIPYEAANKY
jgi:hypothetical protein